MGQTRGYEGAGPDLRDDQSIERQLRIGLCHGLAGYPELVGQQARRRQLLAGCETASADGVPQLAMDLVGQPARTLR